MVEAADKSPGQLHRQANLINSYLLQPRQRAAGRERDLFGLFSLPRSRGGEQGTLQDPAQHRGSVAASWWHRARLGLVPEHGILLGGEETETRQPAAHGLDPSKSRHLNASKHWDCINICFQVLEVCLNKTN